MSPGLRRALLLAPLVAALVAVGVRFAVERRAPRPGPPPPVIATLPDFVLTERSGALVTRAELAGSPWIADFIFTRCRVYCPRLTERMKELGGRLGEGSDVLLVSITVDPEHDTPAVLTEYANAHGLSHRADWLFLTGPRPAIWELVRRGFLLPVEETPANPDMPILHSNRFVLVDGEGRMRGAYDAFEPDALDRLLADLEAVRAEGRVPDRR